MKLKTAEIDGKVYAELADGNPLLVDDNGQESPFDILRSMTKIRELGRESQKHREVRQAAEERLRMFEGIEDPDEARNALEFKRNAKDGDFVAAGKVDEIKAALKRTFEEQHAATVRTSAQRMQELEGQLADVSGKYNSEIVGNAFANSKFIREKIAVPAGMIRKSFGDQFKIEDGKMVGYRSDGTPIVTPTGDPAPFEEALETIVNHYPDKELILRGSGSSGSGAKPSNGGASLGARKIARSDYDRMPPQQQREIALATTKGQAQIVGD